MRWLPCFVIACLLLTSPASAAEQLQPVPVSPTDPTSPLGPPLIVEAEPSVGPPLSSVQDVSAVSIHVTSPRLTKTVRGGDKTVSFPLGHGQIEGSVEFPAVVDARATSISLQQTSGLGSWQVQPRDLASSDQVGFVLRGTDPADLTILVQPPLGGSPVRFALHLTPDTVVTAADAGGSLQLEPGERFSLELADGYSWNASVDDQAVVTRVQDEPPVFQAAQPGSTTLVVNGDPTCYGLRTGCLIPSLSFEVQLVV